ncbi:MAG TPA: hypothetical protein VK469_23515, partial [Candidatus Kapabacteria bacterium]|nr:hypothetical protein [Candidatus Kapabacteria bacterium]
FEYLPGYSGKTDGKYAAKPAAKRGFIIDKILSQLLTGRGPPAPTVLNDDRDHARQKTSLKIFGKSCILY